jgi:anti-sigma regulatory factor (Ser/Thr protein kinase)
VRAPSRAEQVDWPHGATVRTLELAGGKGAPAAARRAVGECLRDSIPAQRFSDAVLLVSELVTNSVRHGGAGVRDCIRVRIAVATGRLVVEVHDEGPGFEPPAVPAPRPTGGGMGLVLVNSLSRGWGVRTGSGTTVWFELAFSPARP